MKSIKRLFGVEKLKIIIISFNLSPKVLQKAAKKKLFTYNQSIACIRASSAGSPTCEIKAI